MAVRLGEHNITSIMDSQEDQEVNGESFTVQDIYVESAIAYPKYEKERKRNDIGLIRLKSAANLEAPNIGTICLPTREESQFEALRKFDEEILEEMTIAGWGSSDNGTRSEVLMKGRVSCFEIEERLLDLMPIHAYYSWIFVNARSTNRKFDICLGDSGGSLFAVSFFRGKSRYLQYGVALEGFTCEKNLSRIYTKVENYIKWILDTME